MPAPVLDADELGRRIKAARAALGLETQRELGALFIEKGYGKHDAARLERGDKEFTGKDLRALTDTTGFPERWFTEPLSEVFAAQADPDVAALLERVEQHLSQIDDRVEELEAHRSEGDDPDLEGALDDDTRSTGGRAGESARATEKQAEAG